MQTVKLTVTKGGPLPFAWDILAPGLFERAGNRTGNGKTVKPVAAGRPI